MMGVIMKLAISSFSKFNLMLHFQQLNAFVWLKSP